MKGIMKGIASAGKRTPIVEGLRHQGMRAESHKNCFLLKHCIGVGRFRILRGGGQGAFRRHVPTRFLINQCQIITDISHLKI